MKKIFLIAIVGLIFSTASFAQRGWANSPADNTGRNTTYKNTPVAYSSTVTLTPAPVNVNYVQVAALTGTALVTGRTSQALLDDELNVSLLCDTLTAGRVVTFSTGFSGNGLTITVGKSKRTCVRFIFDGTAWVRTGE